MTSNKDYLEQCNIKELKTLGLLSQTDLAKYLKVSFRTIYRHIKENKRFCYPFLIKKRKYYHPTLVDKYCEKFPLTYQQIKAEQQKKKMENAQDYLNEILKTLIRELN